VESGYVNTKFSVVYICFKWYYDLKDIKENVIILISFRTHFDKRKDSEKNVGSNMSVFSNSITDAHAAEYH